MPASIGLAVGPSSETGGARTLGDLWTLPHLGRTSIAMSAQRVATFAAIGAVAAWAAKAVAIAIAGGLDLSPAEGPLFLLGLALIVLAFGAAGLAAAAGRGPVLRALGALGGIAVGLIGFLLVEAAVGALVPSSAGWVQEEAGLWVASLLFAGAMLAWSRRGTQRSVAH